MHLRILRLCFFAGAVGASALACGPGDAESPGRTPLADKWLVRADASYKSGDFDDAQSSAGAALEVAPKDPAIRILNAKLALAHLDYARALKLTEGLQTSEAHSIRGRAHWYAGEIDDAADDLEAEVQDPQIKDPWAREISKLARRGSGRHPFAMDGGIIAEVEMPPAGAALVVPCELEGERILAVVATASGEVILDSNTRREPAWVNLTFGDAAQIEVRDVPALTEDLSALSRQLGAPVKALLGVNLLRRMHATFDRRGDQFVVRKDDPPAPPDASRLPLWYVRGGGMLLRGSLAKDEKATFLVDSSQPYFIALSDPMWKIAAADGKSVQADPTRPDVRGAPIPLMRLAGFELPQVPALSSAALNGVQSNVDVDLGGVIGASLISAFRVTFGDEGRFIWMEPDMTQQRAAVARSTVGTAAGIGPAAEQHVAHAAIDGSALVEPDVSVVAVISYSALEGDAEKMKGSSARLAVYAGSFDPVTLGHLDLIDRAAALFSDVIVAIGVHPTRDPLFSADERIALLEKVVGKWKNVRVDSFDGLLIDFCRERRARVIVRGLRAATDFEYELQIAHANADLCPEIDTIFSPTRTKHGFVSASLVREIASHGGDVSRYAPPEVRIALKSKFGAKQAKSKKKARS